MFDNQIMKSFTIRKGEGGYFSLNIALTQAPMIDAYQIDIKCKQNYYKLYFSKCIYSMKLYFANI